MSQGVYFTTMTQISFVDFILIPCNRLGKNVDGSGWEGPPYRYFLFS